ncbi:MAG: hypothetical protein JWO82_1064 [Akkermansiaceae bacterium]|nr:hypothetical protein [Akkermansiaceae bacterium]
MKRLLFLAVSLALPFLNSCQDTLKGVSIADTKVAAIRTSYNAEDYAAIYAAADPAFKAATSQEDFLKLFTTLHEKLGKFKSATQTSGNTNTLNGATTTVLEEDTEFELAKAKETYTFTITDGKATLFNYHIESSALVSKEPATPAEP